jgi:hypothetical protein
MDEFDEFASEEWQHDALDKILQNLPAGKLRHALGFIAQRDFDLAVEAVSSAMMQSD